MIAMGIMRLYPTAVRDEDWVVQDDSDGSGPRVVKWNADKLGSLPTDQVLSAAGQEMRQELLAARTAAESSYQQALSVLSALDSETATTAEVQTALAYVIRKLTA